jgi:CubicO group peptidase (beta-lactamase class C family)
MKETAYMPRDWFAGRLAVARGPKGDIVEKPRTKWTAADLVRTTIDDYAKFMVAVMHNQGLSKEVAAQRLTITRDTATPEEKTKLCASAGVVDCKLRVGMGLGWQIIDTGSEKIVNHGGSDTGVHTYAFYVPSSQVGVVIFTTGENGSKVIRQIVEALHPDPMLLGTL